MFLRILITLGLILVGVFYLYKAISLKVKSRAAMKWPVTRAKILSSEAKEDTLRNATGKVSSVYFAAVSYEYVVGGKTMQGNRVTFGNPTYDYVTASKIRDKFSVGSEMNVSYDPENPAVSVLVPYAREAMRSYIPGIFFIASGIIVAVLMFIYG